MPPLTVTAKTGNIRIDVAATSEQFANFEFRGKHESIRD
jgi:hypothetical protein